MYYKLSIEAENQMYAMLLTLIGCEYPIGTQAFPYSSFLNETDESYDSNHPISANRLAYI